MPRHRVFLKYWLPVILWMCVIFSVSTDLGSERRTSRFIGPLLRWFKPDISPQTIREVQYAVRKCGHAVEYAILALLFWRARRRPVRQDPRPWQWSEALLAVGFASLYAVSDELHQLIVPSREARIMDVLIDAGGAMGGLLALWLWRRGCRRG